MSIGVLYMLLKTFSKFSSLKLNLVLILAENNCTFMQCYCYHAYMYVPKCREKPICNCHSLVSNSPMITHLFRLCDLCDRAQLKNSLWLAVFPDKISFKKGSLKKCLNTGNIPQKWKSAFLLQYSKRATDTIH